MRLSDLSLFVTRALDAIVTRSANAVPVSRAAIQNGVALRILPLGASITLGQDSTGQNGYRESLRELLENSGNNVTYVGTRHVGTMKDNAVQAISGQIIQQIDATASSSNVYRFAPNVILLNAGTNNCAKQNFSLSETSAAYANLLKHIHEKVPDALTVVSSLVPNLKARVNACVEQLNPEIRRVAMTASTAGQKIAYVDMYGAVPRSDINTTDGTHPNDAGYAIMAHVWFDGLHRAGVNISAPTALNGSQLVTPTNTPDSADSSSDGIPSGQSAVATPDPKTSSTASLTTWPVSLFPSIILCMLLFAFNLG